MAGVSAFKEYSAVPNSNTQQPVWHSRPVNDPQANDWLFNQQSLTSRLRQLSHGQFGVQPLFEGWQQLRADECQVLGCPPGSSGWARIVFLTGLDTPWVYARSVASREQLLDSGFDLAGLGQRPLGELLFNDQAFDRGEIEICQLQTTILSAAAQPYCQPGTSLLARRSCFTSGALKILVAEAFLPAFWQHLKQTSA